MQEIFIHFHPRDSKWFANRLFVTLSSSFGIEKIRLGIDSLSPYHEGFEDRIDKAIQESVVFLMLIGKEWRRRWIYDTHDPYYKTIEKALQIKANVLLILVDNATLPYQEALLDELKPLHQLPQMPITRNEFMKKSFDLVSRVRQMLERAGIDPNPNPEQNINLVLNNPDDEVVRPERRGVVISYNKEDTGWLAGRVQNTLADRFGYGEVRLGVQSVIHATADAVQSVEATVKASAAFIVILGPHILRDFHSPLNFDRLALAAALRDRLDIIALTLEGTEFPVPSKLPHELQLLAVKKHFPITNINLSKDLEPAIALLRKVIDEVNPHPSRFSWLTKLRERFTGVGTK